MILKQAIAPFEDYLKDFWGKEYPELVRCVERLTVPWQETVAYFDSPPFQGGARGGSEKVLVFFGERTEMDEQYEAAKAAMGRLYELGVEAMLLFSGGVTDREWAGEVSAEKLYEEFIRRYHGLTLPLPEGELEGVGEIEVDMRSMNTGMQATMLARLAKEDGVRTFVLALPLDHIARFAAALGEALKEVGLLEKCRILPLAYGTWDTKTCCKKLTMAREAFGPAELTNGREKSIERELRQRADQCGKRWYLPMVEKGSEHWLCGSLSPSELLDWLDDYK